MGSNQYGHDTPQIHQVQHIANVETLQQFSPAYPLQPIYRPVIYTNFKENDAGALRTASNATETDDKKKKDTKNTSENTKTNEKVVNPETNIPLATSEKTAQEPKIEKMKQNVSTEMVKSEVTEASLSKLPIPMDKVLAINAAKATASMN